MTAETPHVRLAHLPDTEETEDMIYTVSIEIVLHLTEPFLPPSEVILRHLIPVIGRESPVLAGDREVIGRCSCGSVQVKELRINGCIDGVGADTDRYISFHRHAYRVGVSHCVRQLFVGMELQEIVVLLRLLVALVEELGIGLQPLAVLLKERLVLLGGEEGILVLLEERLEEDGLGVIDVLVIGDLEGVELRLLCLVFLLLRRRQATHLLDIDIYRMEREDGNSVVRITVEVIMTERGIVDRQGLDHLLARSRSPVCHLLEVLELTDTEALLRTEREDRNSYAGTFPSRLRAAETTVVLADNHTLLDAPDLAVLTPLHIYLRAGLEVINEVFILDDLRLRDLDICFPNRELRIAHNELVIDIPVA